MLFILNKIKKLVKLTDNFILWFKKEFSMILDYTKWTLSHITLFILGTISWLLYRLQTIHNAAMGRHIECYTYFKYPEFFKKYLLFLIMQLIQNKVDYEFLCVNNGWLVWYNNIDLIYRLNTSTWWRKLDILYWTIQNTKNTIKFRAKSEMHPVVNLAKLSYFARFCFVLMTMCISCVLLYQILAAITIACFFIMYFLFNYLLGYQVEIEYKAKMPIYNHMSCYAAYQIIVAQPIARGFIIAYYSIKVSYLVFNNLFNYYNLITNPDSELRNNANYDVMSYIDYLKGRGSFVILYSNIITAIILIIIAVTIKWKICIYTGVSYYSIIVAADCISVLFEEKTTSLWKTGNFKSYWWTVLYYLFGSGSLITQHSRTLKIILSYSSYVNDTYPKYNINDPEDIKDKFTIKSKLYADVDPISDFLTKEELLERLNLDADANLSESDNDESAPLKYVVIFNPKTGSLPEFNILREPSRMHEFFKKLASSSRIFMPMDTYTGKYSYQHKGMGLELNNELYAINATSKQYLTTKLFNSISNKYDLKYILLTKQNFPGYNASVLCNYWSPIYKIPSSFVNIKEQFTWYLDNPDISQDIKNINTLELVLRLSNYFNTSDDFKVYFSVISGDDKIHYQISYINKFGQIPHELRELVDLFNFIVNENLDIFHYFKNKIDFENDLWKYIELTGSFKLVNSKFNQKKSIGDLSKFFGDDDPIKH